MEQKLQGLSSAINKITQGEKLPNVALVPKMLLYQLRSDQLPGSAGISLVFVKQEATSL